MYYLHNPVSEIKGIGETVQHTLMKENIKTVEDLVLYVPLRYEDRSKLVTISALTPNELVTVQAKVIKSQSYYRGRRSIQSATLQDSTGRVKAMWFNSAWVMNKVKEGEELLFSGKVNDKGLLVHPTVESVSANTIHTNRLVPIYSTLPSIKPGLLRRWLKETVDNLAPLEDETAQLMPLDKAIKQIHFPDSDEMVVHARERLALEELVAVIHHAKQTKKHWQEAKNAPKVRITTEAVPTTLPFQLTKAQHKALSEILSDLQTAQPMNRMLVGDVGSGKTVVAGLAARQMLHNLHQVALIAPTQILAQQHYQTVAKLFPDLRIELITGTDSQVAKKVKIANGEITWYIGTHALINHLEEIQPGLVVYDEQHRFGVGQRSQPLQLSTGLTPHVLTMTATPIPRSLMLTLFDHLEVSLIDELPVGRKPVTTWLVSERKRESAYEWLKNLLEEQPESLAIVVCPFIDPSHQQALENVAAAHETFKKISQQFPESRVKLLHGQLKKKEKQQVSTQLFANEIDILVTTPVIEVGLDVPSATAIIIEGAERFGLASLHQLRGRVGRANQQAFCLLFPTPGSTIDFDRLKTFCQTNNGLQLAELDLSRRGAGDLFGTQQHGFDHLRFASWSDLSLINQAKERYEELKGNRTYHPLLSVFALEESSEPTVAGN